MTTWHLPDTDAAHLMHRAGRSCGLTTRDARLTHRDGAAVFTLGTGVTAEVSGPGLLDRARRQAAVSRWLSDHAITVLRPPADTAWLVEVDDHTVAFREPLPPHRPGDYGQIAGVLRQLHSLAPPHEPVLGPVDPFRRVEQRLWATPLVTAAERGGLLGRLRQSRADYAQLPPGLPDTPLHGDAWAGNIVALADGRMLVRDLERVSVGPPEWDLVSTAIDASTFGAMSPDQYRQFSETYGHDVVAWAGFGTLLTIRELRVVAFALAAAEGHPRRVEQAQLRVRACLAGERPWPGWQPL